MMIVEQLARRMRLAPLALVSAWLLAACTPMPALRTPALTVSQLRLIGEQRLPLRQQFEGTMVGGLSGIDYDAARGDWVLISDDRSEHNPARFYRARLDYDALQFKAAVITSVTTLRQPDGSAYPSKEAFEARRVGVVADLEALRVDPRDGSIWYGSEGDISLGLKPFVRQAGADGRFLAELPLPPLFEIDPAHKFGPRDNQSIEGISFAPDGQSLWVSLEDPLYQDGPLPTVLSGAVNRITRFGRDGTVIGQYAYPLGPIQATPGKGKYADNGISEIVALSATRLLVMERSAVEDDAGVYRVYVRIYEVDTTGATDVQGAPNLHDTAYSPVKKRVVLDVNALNLPKVDNLEGMALGPRLANGNASLVLVSDDNFNKAQVMQFLVFEVIP